ncbi:MAG: ATP-dependent helicase [Candidatus Taylorbacteria bacterium]|nr:ATP-dependent helicase [Candidatus Taylorbacteria bacterium]
MTSDKFKKDYGNLNSNQKDAVDSIDGPVMVIAGPGTGKTTILTLRIAKILLSPAQIPPGAILALTFTEAGVKTMRMKLRDIIGSRADEVRIHTFHGFAAAIISEFQDHFVHLERVKQLTDIEAENMIRGLLEVKEMRDLRPFGNPDFYIQKIISAISDCKRETQTPELVREFVKKEIKRINSDDESVSTRGKTKGEFKAEAKKQLEKCERTMLFADLFEAYEDKKKKNRKMDFDDLISELVIALKKDELLLRMLQEKFLYILVDEHQDTNNSQNELVTILADFFDVPNVFIVGDEKQAIYRFQGASVENFLKFEKKWKEMKIIRLEDNYRSHQSILDASFSMIENNYEKGEHENLRIKLSARSKQFKKPVDIVSGDNIEAVEGYLIGELKKRMLENNITTAIITKTNRDLERVLHLCEAEGIPVSSQRSIDIFSHPLGALFFDLIEFINDPTKFDLLGKTLIAGFWGLSFEDTVTLIKSVKSGKNIKLEEKIPVLKIIRKELTTDAPLGFLVHVALLSGFEKLISREPSYVEVWRGVLTLAENLIRESDIISPSVLISRLVAYRASAETKSVKISVGTPDLPIRAMTAHGSKGLEFDYVYVPYATEESWVGRNWGNSFVLPHTKTSNDIKDVRRLFYVALTRARAHATILYAGTDHGEPSTPLRFIDELHAGHVKHVILDKLHDKKAINSHTYQTSSHAQKCLDYTKSVLQESGLSVTALNHFLKCPSLFLYQSILKIPQAPAALAEKGNAMHKAIDIIWKSKDRTVNNVEKILKNTIENYFDDSLLPLFEKEAVVKELNDDIPIISKALGPHFAQEGTIFSETWSETVFNKIPLHGKLDAILDTGKEALVFDYKTKQTMSENEIKGLTKNSKGDYFRQLVFYKLLLQSDSRFENKKITPSLVFVVPDAKDRCPTVTLLVDESDIQKLKTEIQSLVDSVSSGALMTDYCDDTKCEWCGVKKLLR